MTGFQMYTVCCPSHLIQNKVFYVSSRNDKSCWKNVTFYQKHSKIHILTLE